MHTQSKTIYYSSICIYQFRLEGGGLEERGDWSEDQETGEKNHRKIKEGSLMH